MRDLKKSTNKALEVVVAKDKRERIQVAQSEEPGPLSAGNDLASTSIPFLVSTSRRSIGSTSTPLHTLADLL